ncbi:7304_t:CDS:2, partial [Scutellospora calospora]
MKTTEDSKPKPPEKILLDNIASIFFPDASYVDPFGFFDTDEEEATNVKFDNSEIKYDKTSYKDKNIVTNSLIAVNRFGQSFTKDFPKAFKLRLHGFFNQVNMSIILNAGKEGVIIDSENTKKIYEPPGNFIITLSFLNGKKTGDANEKENEKNFPFMKEQIELEDIFKKGTFRFDNTDDNIKSRINEDKWEFMFAVDTPVNVNELSKNTQMNKPQWYDFNTQLYYTHTNKGQKNESQGMPYGVKRVDEEKNLIIYCCDKETITDSKGQQTNIVGYQPNIIWVLTMTLDSDIMKKNIENSLKIPNIEYNTDITFFGKEPLFPTHPGPFLLINKIIPMIAYETNIDSVANLKHASGSALKQLVDAVKHAIENPDKEFDIPFDPNSNILSYYNKKINEKTKIVELQPKSLLYNQIQNNTRLGPWNIKELNDVIKQKGNELIEKSISEIKNEKDQDKIKKNIESLKKINKFFINDKDKFNKDLDLLQSKLKIINDSKISPNILNNHVSITFLERRKKNFKLKPLYFFSNISLKNSLKIILDRYKKNVEVDNENIIHINKIILSNLKSYKGNFYTKPWKPFTHH